jgi:hypothetical protein
MSTGNARIAALDNEGKSVVDDVAKNDLWFFPTGVRHSIQGLGRDGCEFLFVFDDAKFSEADVRGMREARILRREAEAAGNLGVAQPWVGQCRLRRTGLCVNPISWRRENMLFLV